MISYLTSERGYTAPKGLTRPWRALYKKAIMGGKIKIKNMILEVLGGKGFWGISGGDGHRKALKNIRFHHFGGRKRKFILMFIKFWWENINVHDVLLMFIKTIVVIVK